VLQMWSMRSKRALERGFGVVFSGFAWGRNGGWTGFRGWLARGSRGFAVALAGICVHLAQCLRAFYALETVRERVAERGRVQESVWKSARVCGGIGREWAQAGLKSGAGVGEIWRELAGGGVVVEVGVQGWRWPVVAGYGARVAGVVVGRCSVGRKLLHGRSLTARHHVAGNIE